MIICKDDFYAYCGNTAAEAYSAYMNSNDDHNCLGPDKVRWYNATEMTLTMTLAAKAQAGQAKTAAKK